MKAIEGFDNSMATLHWSAAFGLICGPHLSFCWPVPHMIDSNNETDNGSDSDSEEFDILTIFPLRVCGMKGKVNRQNYESSIEKLEISFARERWLKREAMIWKEWLVLKEKYSSLSSSPLIQKSSTMTSIVSSLSRSLSFNSNSITNPISSLVIDDDAKKEGGKSMNALVAYGPSLPLLALADALRLFSLTHI